ncbi:endo alpha-1,4 polygalactosaminidase [Cellulophaga sp. HaHaR_3_176]|uniref:endo alpha-1,4 polygalactosaminidase n=1 Tax=Cellulophaga sp. HaHaR_3_176 TaxID=1942464 RepID=UPI001C1F414D|nr:endo alpha-1,4 polygalactosaminidase [Cellulophaga sp. HaHaR_3_176]QWX83833.1 endo alpha-1,4 polygalactosaminidase [Cellulophaga sp. HaHaR_3_176]
MSIYKSLLAFALIVLAVCTSGFVLNKTENNSVQELIDYRGEMRSLVIKISKYAKRKNSSFVVVPQNGIELVTENGEVNGPLSLDYLKAIDGNGQEDLFFGYDGDNKSTPRSIKRNIVDFLKVSQNTGNTILVTDYCSSPQKIEVSKNINNKSGFVSYAAIKRDLNIIPFSSSPVHNQNSNSVKKLKEVKNFLYLINFEKYTSKKALINTIASTNYDMVLIDLFFNDKEPFTKQEIKLLKTKANGGKRLVVCYMSIGEAEDYRFYWNENWLKEKPSWLDKENKKWKGNYKVKYWDQDWQKILMGSKTSYLDLIIGAEFDGVYLDIIDGFEYFEDLK